MSQPFLYPLTDEETEAGGEEAPPKAMGGTLTNCTNRVIAQMPRHSPLYSSAIGLRTLSWSCLGALRTEQVPMVPRRPACLPATCQNTYPTPSCLLERHKGRKGLVPYTDQRWLLVAGVHIIDLDFQQGWQYNPMAEYLPSAHKAAGLLPYTADFQY